jgi:hypothetical protein
MVSQKTAWRLGAEAARSGKSLKANPFEPGTSQHQSWSEGWQLEASLPKREKPQPREGK